MSDVRICRAKIKREIGIKHSVQKYSVSVFEKARDGDETALNSLLVSSQPDIQRYARRTCRSADIDDAVQETLLILARRVGTIKMLTSLPAWLFIVVKRECIRATQKTMGVKFSDIEQFHDDIELSSKPDHELRIDLVRAILSLPEHYRYVVLLRDVKGMTIEEIANNLSQSREGVKARLHRARLLIREYLI